MRDLIGKVKQWGLDRNIVFTGAECQDKRAMMEAQARYTLKETAELLDAYADQDIDKINDAIGDILVTLIVGASSDDGCYERVRDCLVNGWLASCESSEDFFMQYSDLIDSIKMLFESLDDDSEDEYHFVINSLYSITEHVDGLSTLKDCLELAYNEIKNRTGKVVKGQFIKDK